MEWLDWQGCYDEGWKGVIVDEAFRHPAKFAYGLVTRIYRHGLDRGYFKPGDLIGDPFGGVGLGGIVAAYHNLRWIGVELESHANAGSPFVELAQQNFAFHEPRWKAGDDPVPVIVQGDSRRFAEIVGEVCGVVTSPPFVDSLSSGKLSDEMREELRRKGHKPSASGESAMYGTADGQIGALKAGSLDAVVTSPPYAESVKGDHSERETAAETTAKRRTQGGSLGQSQRHGGYGASEGNIGNLREGVIDGAVTSPPWEQGDQRGCPESKIALQEAVVRDGRGHGGKLGPSVGKSYGESDGQIGNDAGETYWQAMHAVYGQMFLAMKPGGTPVPDDPKVDFCDCTT